MSRLLFAVARGARLQCELLSWSKNRRLGWSTDRNPDLAGVRSDSYRIHPEDEHLQYGPISTALRTMAATGEGPHTTSGLLARVLATHEREFPLIFVREWDRNVLFLLILAEAMADKGL